MSEECTDLNAIAIGLAVLVLGSSLSDDGLRDKGLIRARANIVEKNGVKERWEKKRLK